MLDATRVMNGSFGQVFDANGNWLTNIKSAEAVVEINKEEILRAGTRWVGHKATTLTGTGTITGYKVTTEFAEAIGAISADNGASFVTSIRMKVADPESGTFSVVLSGVQFDRIPLVNYELGAVVEEELPFTFSSYTIDTVLR